LIKRRFLPNNKLSNDTKRYKHNDFDYIRSKKNSKIKYAIEKIKKLLLSGCKLFEKKNRLDLKDKKYIEFEELIASYDTPLKRIRENRTTVEFVEEIAIEGVIDNELYNSLGPE
jgi:hypothetical protein